MSRGIRSWIDRRPALMAVTAGALVIGGISPIGFVPTATAATVYNMTGHGWGHGRGMSQWGARYAADHGVSYQQILGFYYPGTALRTVPQVNVRVLLTAHQHTDVRVRSEPGLRASYRSSTGTRILRTLPTSVGSCRPTLWRAALTGSTVALEGWCNRWMRLVGGITAADSLDFLPVDGNTATTLITPAGAQNIVYRGLIRGVPSGGPMRAVNVVPGEAYLESVVPSEMPASWAKEALRAQAVAARTYAAREILDAAHGYFDVYDSTASQLYRGYARYGLNWALVETVVQPTTTAAVRDTNGRQVYYGSAPALTQFSSSNGGVAAAGTFPYQRAVIDTWDSSASANPRRNWTDTVTDAELEARYPQIGQLQRIVVVRRQGIGDWGGRILDVRLEGSSGLVTISADSAVRAAFGTYSSYFVIT